MDLTLALPALCRDDLTRIGGVQLPALSQLLRFGRFSAAAAAPSEFYGHYLWQGSLLAAAKQSVGVAEGQTAVFASPVWQQMGMHHMDMLGGGAIGMAAHEAERLLADLNAFFAEDGWHFRQLRPDWWLVMLPAEPDWQVAALPDAVGKNDGTLRAEGGDAAQWLQKQTEMQMLLHSHPLNGERAAAGQPAVNGVWLWQDVAGRLNAPSAPLLGSDSPWAQFYPGRRLDAPYSLEVWLAEMQAHGVSDGLLLLDDLAATRDTDDAWAYADILAQWEQRFFAPAYAALRAGRLNSLQIATDGATGGVLRVAAKPGRAFWKRQRLFDGRLG